MVVILAEKYTYSGILSKIAVLEEKIRDFYEKSLEKLSGKAKKLFEEYAKETNEWIDKINWTRQMSVLEMTLEYITGVPLEETINDIEKIISDESKKLIEKAIEIEKKVSKIYDVSADKIYFMSMDASFLLSEMAKKSRERIEKLSKLL